MLSIITAIHNGLPFNKIFEDSLRRYTVSPYELIIIDNVSTDGSREFFESKGSTIIANHQNFSYPVCQNQGIDIAKGDYLCFLNNDLILSPGWDQRLIEAATIHGIDVISASGIENVGDKLGTRNTARRWKRIKNFIKLFGVSEKNLRRMASLMYGNWEEFCERRFEQFKFTVVEGIVGNNVMMTRKAIEKVGRWDERLQVADFDLFMRVKKRSMVEKDIKPCHIALGVYIHHYIRMTSKNKVKPTPFADIKNIIPLDAKWTKADQELMHPDNATLRRRE